MAPVLILLLLTMGKVAPSPSTCADNTAHAPNCEYWKRLGHCSSENFGNFMRDNCAKTCGSCIAVVCVDVPQHAKNCLIWKNLGYCSSQNYSSFMKASCNKTCEICDAPEKKVIPTQTTTSGCEDTAKHVANCPVWKKIGYCQSSSSWIAFMKDHCSKTCEFCSASGKPSSWDCWTGCGGKAGLCSQCGSGYACCRKGWSGDPQECKAANIPCQNHHCCSKLDITPANKCGIGKNDKGRLVGGTDAEANSWPWQVGFYFYDTFFCGGSLIAPQYVLTAAHCMTARYPEGMVVRLGDHIRDKVEGAEQNIEVESFVSHEKYDSTTIENDIAIVKLKKPAALNDKVGVVCLPESGDDPARGLGCYITGWGKMQVDGVSANILQEARMPVVPNERCGEKNVDATGKSRITPNMLCAGHGEGSPISGCHGDSGGPFVCKSEKNRWVLQGVVSWGSSRCDAAHRYTVFARTSEYVDWIQKNMK